MTSQILMAQADQYSNQTISLKDYLKLKKIALFGIFQYLVITAYSMYSFSSEFTLMGSWISEFGNKFLENGEDTEPDNSTSTQPIDYPWKYIFLSERMRNRAFFLIRDSINGTRSIEIRIPFVDVWQNDTRFQVIYDKDGVIIYEKMDR